MTTTASNDLRERMQRVASKPRRRPVRPSVVADLPVDDAVAGSVVSADTAVADDEIEVAEVRRPARPATRRRSAPVRPASRPRPVTSASAPSRDDAPAASRQDALVSWVRWELTAVPLQRWEWLKAVLRGG